MSDLPRIPVGVARSTWQPDTTGGHFDLMQLYQFRRLSAQTQLLLALLKGNHLTSRWDINGRVELYHVANIAQGFFVEVGQEQQAQTVLDSFHDPLLLEEYVSPVQLPASLTSL